MSLEGHISQWKAEGLNIAVITLLIDGPSGGQPTAQDAMTWKNQFSLQNVYVLADPGFSMVAGNSVGTPMQTVVDPRTMLVTFKQEGFNPAGFPELEQLARQNAGL